MYCNEKVGARTITHTHRGRHRSLKCLQSVSISPAQCVLYSIGYTILHRRHDRAIDIQGGFYRSMAQQVSYQLRMHSLT